MPETPSKTSKALLARLAALGGVRLGWALSISLHAALLGAASLVVSGADRTGVAGRTGDDDEVRFRLDLRGTGPLARAAAPPAVKPAEVAPAPKAEPRREPDRDRARDAAIAKLRRARSVLEQALAALPVEEPAEAEPASEPEATAESAASAPPPTEAVAHDGGSSDGTTAEASGGSGAGGAHESTPTGESGSAGSPNRAAPGAFTRAALLDGPAPAYPPKSRRAGEEGDVRCRLHVKADGAVDSVDVLRTSGFTRLDQAARTDLLRWRFRPAEKDGVAVACEIEHTVSFRLR